jgi:phage terminase Nu1 subunit (DNA packaging protein)
VAYLRFLRRTATSERGSSKNLDLATERAHLARARAEAAAMKNVTMRSELVSTASALCIVKSEFGSVRARLKAIPGKLAERFANEAARDVIHSGLQEEIAAALTDLSDRVERRIGK